MGFAGGTDSAVSSRVCAAQPVFSFTIPQGLLAAAIRQFESITGLTVRGADDLVRNLTSEGVTGTFTAAQGLDRLLAGSGLSHRSLSADTVVIEIRVSSDTVEVTSGAPRVQWSKYTANLAETPQTIQVIPRALLEEQGAATLTDALRNVPGITMQAGAGGGASNTSGDMFNMRGFSANNSIFIDGVRDDGMLSRDVFNLEQIEVFSGPTGRRRRPHERGRLRQSDDARRRTGPTARDGEPELRRRASRCARLPTSISRSRWAIAARFSARLRFESTSCGRTAEWPGGTTRVAESKAIAPSVAFGLSTPHSRHTLGTDSPPGQSGRLWPASGRLSCRSTDRHVGSRSFDPVDQSNYYGSPDFDYDHGQSGQRRCCGWSTTSGPAVTRPKSDPLQRVNA